MKMFALRNICTRPLSTRITHNVMNTSYLKLTQRSFSVNRTLYQSDFLTSQKESTYLKIKGYRKREEKAIVAVSSNLTRIVYMWGILKNNIHDRNQHLSGKLKQLLLVKLKLFRLKIMILNIWLWFFTLWTLLLVSKWIFTAVSLSYFLTFLISLQYVQLN